MDDLSLASLAKVPGFLAGISLHEWAHAYVADRAGDAGPRRAGRLTINPAAHLDPLGTIMILVGPIGWGKPVAVSPSAFSHPAKDMMRVALAGPLTNLVLASASLLGIRLLVFSDGYLSPTMIDGLSKVLVFSVVFNVVMTILNLLPLHPLDGSRVLNYLVSDRVRTGLGRFARYGPLVLVFVVFARILDPVYTSALDAIVAIGRSDLWAPVLFLAFSVACWIVNASVPRKGWVPQPAAHLRRSPTIGPDGRPTFWAPPKQR